MKEESVGLWEVILLDRLRDTVDDADSFDAPKQAPWVGVVVRGFGCCRDLQ